MKTVEEIIAEAWATEGAALRRVAILNRWKRAQAAITKAVEAGRMSPTNPLIDITAAMVEALEKSGADATVAWAEQTFLRMAQKERKQKFS